MIGVVYKFKPYNKVNGTLFYCYEYCQFLRQFVDCKMYISGASQSDASLISRLFSEKYSIPVSGIEYINRTTDVHRLGLSRTLILDVDTFKTMRGFLTGDVLCYSNDTHEMFRYADGRTVTYFGSYAYQPRDVFAYLRINFGIFKPCTSAPGVFVSGNDCANLTTLTSQLSAKFPQLPLYIKSKTIGSGDIFDHITAVHYVHNKLDKNNRIIPEAFFHNKAVTFDDTYNLPTDSALLRYRDINSNGLVNYTICEQDPIIQACLK